ncbi:energy-coupling factor transporter transmembrane component T family protein [Aquipuribacter sp. MA13-6]|uniref:energy-coupling factor transporter transmembrane component T family protein n=1 Tax=unclassified Aquipuribacter TaxID=2635084 RepID=UPI003EEABF92
MSATARLAPDERAAPSPLGRVDPTVKLGVLVVVSAAMLLVLHPFVPTVLYLLGLVAVAAGTRLPARTLALAHLPFVAFATGLLLVNVLSRPGEVLWRWGVLRVTVEGVEVGSALAARTLLIGVLAIGFIASTGPVALMTSLHQNARLGARVTHALLAGYRMLQQMPQEWQTIRQAHAVRAPLRTDGRLPRSPRFLAGVVFTLLVVSVRRGERLAQSLESRGLGLQPRTTWRPAPLRARDAWFAGSVLVVMVAVLLLGWSLDLLDGPGALTG